MTTLDALVLAAARRWPDAVAVRQYSAELTYSELVGRAAGLAQSLRSGGAGPESRVGVRIGRHPDLPVALLGVLMSGAAYVPLDPALPAQRLEELGADVDVVLTDASAPAGEVPSPRHVPGNPAYVIYTSGSTGRPKGVVIPHSAVGAFVGDSIVHTGVGPGDRALAFASIGFDVSVLEIFVPLAAGATVCLMPDSDRQDAARIQRFCAEHAITWASISPVLLPLLDPTSWKDLRVLMTGDEPPGPEQVARWAAPGRRFLNCYGPTETTVQVTAFEAGQRHDGPLPIGRALGDHRLHVVDGELLIGGPGLARGYLDRPGLTAAAFVPDPYSGIPGARLYRTGDLVSLGDDGELRFHGRRDRQVKIRGQRVEAGELEAVLRGHPEITHAVVEVDPGPTLHAYLSSTLDAETVRAWCAERLPAALVPDRITLLGEFPVTPSHKVDRAALRDPMTRLWAREIGDAALNSISAMRLAAAIRDELGKDVSTADIFAGWTLGGVRERVAAAPALTESGPVAGHPARLTAAQRRLWFVDQLAPGSAAYNIAMAQRIRGPLDVERLRAALTEVARRHEVLRWRIPHRDGVPFVEVDPPEPVPLHHAASLDGLAGRRFDLATGPLWQAWLVPVAVEEHVLAITAHHAIFDGWSEAVLYRDLSAAYGGGALEPLPTQFGDYAAWRDAQPSTLDWWLDHLRGAPPVLRLPTDHVRPAVQTYRGAIVRGCVPDPDRVASLACKLGVAPATVLLARYARFIGTLSNQDTVVIGAPLADRRLAEFAELIGFFVDIVPLRVAGAVSLPFEDLVLACGEEMLAALANPAAPLEDVIAGLGLARDPGRHPLVQTLFNVFNFAPPELSLDGLSVEPIPSEVAGSPFDLTAYLTTETEVELVYNPDLFTERRMRALLDAWVTGDTPPGWLREGAAEAVRIPVQRQAAGGDTELVVASIWREVLGHNDFGVTDNFFEVGGRSLTLVRLQARLASLGYEVSVVELFRLPTVRSQAAHLDPSGGAHAGGLQAGEDRLARAAARASARAEAARRRRSR